MSRPKTQFDNTLARATDLLDIFDQREADFAMHGVDLIDADRDLVRASMLLSVAGLDHYFTQKFCDKLVGYLKSNEPNDQLVKLLSNSGLNTKSALELLVMDRPFRRVRTMVQDNLSRYTSHRTQKIDQLFQAMGYKKFCKNIEKRAGRRNLLKRVSRLVDLRNDIAHTAHLNSRGLPKAIDRDDVHSLVQDLSIFVAYADHEIEDK
ncbi:MAG: HEPN domain-containing protein [Pseudomonadota bacterium]